jgi:hypothetical protein
MQNNPEDRAESLNEEVFVNGHPFNRANQLNQINGALQAAAKLVREGFVKGHDFSRADKAKGISGASAPANSPIRNIPPQSAVFLHPLEANTPKLLGSQPL